MSEKKQNVKWVGALVLICAAVTLAVCIAGLSGCSTLDRAYKEEVTWTNAPVVHVFTNTVVVTNTVPVVTERTNVVYITNQVSGTISGYATREPIATNLLTAIVTNFVPVFMTNFVQVPMTNLVDKPEAEATIQATGSLINTFAPGIGSIVALALGGVYHAYRQVRNKQVNQALVQGVETARAVLTTTPQGQAADAQFVRWLMQHQKEAGVFTIVSDLVEELSDNPAAKMTAQEIAQRVHQSRQQTATQAAA